MASRTLVASSVCISIICILLVECRNVDVVWKKSASVPRAIDSRDFRYGLTRIGKRLSKSSRATNLRDFRNGLTRIGKRYYIIPANSWDY